MKKKAAFASQPRFSLTMESTLWLGCSQPVVETLEGVEFFVRRPRSPETTEPHWSLEQSVMETWASDELFASRARFAVTAESCVSLEQAVMETWVGGELFASRPRFSVTTKPDFSLEQSVMETRVGEELFAGQPSRPRSLTMDPSGSLDFSECSVMDTKMCEEACASQPRPFLTLDPKQSVMETGAGEGLFRGALLRPTTTVPSDNGFFWGRLSRSCFSVLA